MSEYRLNDRFRPYLWARFLFFFGLFFVPAYIGLGASGQKGLRTGWIISAAGFFVLVLPAVLCRHCPHYARRGWFIICPSTVGPPKLLKSMSKPVSRPEKAVFAIGFAFVLSFPVGVLAAVGRLGWAGASLAGAGLFFFLEQRFSCSRCLNFTCALNRVPGEVKAGCGQARRAHP